jgi:4,5-DOPA dioxygenase extradiol
MSRMPTLFLSHGAPPSLDDAAWLAALTRWGTALPRPTAILSVSAHWEARPATIGARTALPLVYDFYGFPEHYYRMTYPAPGVGGLADRIAGLLRGANIAVTEDPTRGLDHGTWVPLIGMYPKADVPVVQLSLPSLEPKELAAMGRALTPLRDEGVLLIGSGFATHNLRMLGTGRQSWATEFDDWLARTVEAHDLDGLVDFAAKAPGARLAHPRTEHFVPMLVAAAAAPDGPVAWPITGWQYGPFSMRSGQFG